MIYLPKKMNIVIYLPNTPSIQRKFLFYNLKHSRKGKWKKEHGDHGYMCRQYDTVILQWYCSRLNLFIFFNPR